MLHEHWLELALYQDKIPLDPDYPAYVRACEAGLMKVYTARDEGRLIGYANFFVVPQHMHYRHRWAKNDIIWISPSHRDGRASVRLLRFAEEDLRATGPIVIQIETKDHQPALATLLELLGYDKVGESYGKRLG
jgi:hypothetical protein